jgi:hypothetical protein
MLKTEFGKVEVNIKATRIGVDMNPESARGTGYRAET